MEIIQASEPVVVFLLVDAADFQTPRPGKQPKALLSAAGSSFVPAKNAVDEIGDGWYKLKLAAAETSAPGPLVLRASAADTNEWRDIHYVVTAPTPVAPPENGGDGGSRPVPVDPPPVKPAPEPAQGDSILRNGDFSKGKSDWILFNEGAPGEANWSVEKGVATLVFPSVSDNMQFYQPNLTVRKGKYRVAFEAKGKAGHTLEVFLHQHKQPYLSLGLADGVRLGEEWGNYVLEFEVPQSDTGGRLRFWFVGHANKGDKFQLRNVELRPVGSS